MYSSRIEWKKYNTKVLENACIPTCSGLLINGYAPYFYTRSMIKGTESCKKELLLLLRKTKVSSHWAGMQKGKTL